ASFHRALATESAGARESKENYLTGGHMATFERSVTTDWEGGLMDGKGEAKAGSGAFTLPVTFPNRIGEPAGKTSPEELMAAAHAACFAMAMNAALGKRGGKAK